MDGRHPQHRPLPGRGDGPSRSSAPAGRGSLLALRCLGLGDFVTAVPALRALEREFAHHKRLLAAPVVYRDLVRLAGLTWTVLASEPLRTPPWRGPAPDVAVNLHGRGPQSTAVLRGLAPTRLWSYAPPGEATTGAPDERASRSTPPRYTEAPWPGAVHDSRLWCGLLEWNGVRTVPTDMLWPRPADHDGELGARPATAVLHPGAKTASRRWPPERFALVARWLREQGLRVVLTGSAEERPLACRVAREAGLSPQAVVAGRTDLPCLARLVADAGLLVSGDTGVAHLATVYGTPSVRLFGPVSPALWGPLIDLDRHECLWTGRTGDPHGDRLDPGLDALGFMEVREACERALRRDRTSPWHVEVHEPPAGASGSGE